MEREYRIIVEGEGDSVLIMMLLKVIPYNANGVGNLLNHLEQVKTGQRVVGVCDYDKDRRKLLENKFDLVEQKTEMDLKVLKDKENRSLVIIKPALEKWLLKAADSVDVDYGNFGFQSEKHFKRTAKSIQVESNNNFKNFINTINQKNAPAFVQLKDWINEIL